MTLFDRYGFHVSHRPHGFDLTYPESTETPLFRCEEAGGEWHAVAQGKGLQQLYPAPLTAMEFTRLLDTVRAATAAYLLPPNLVARYLYFLNLVRLHDYYLSQEHIVMLANMPVPFERQLRALHAQGAHDIYHVIKIAEMDDAQFIVWQQNQGLDMGKRNR